MRFDLTDLRLFTFIIETGITHGAAKANSISLPSRARGGSDRHAAPRAGPAQHRGAPPRATRTTMRASCSDRSIACRGNWANIRSGARPVSGANIGSHHRISPARPRPVPARPSERAYERATAKAVLAERRRSHATDAVDHGALQTFPFATDQFVLVVSRDRRRAAHRASGCERTQLHRALRRQPDAGVSGRAGRALGLTLDRARVRTFDGI